MFADLVDLFRDHPEMAIFLSLAAGYYIGKIKIAGFSLGSTTGTLLAAILVGQISVTIDPFIKQVFFSLFIFTIGYKVGPQFFSSLKHSVKVVVLSSILCVTGLVVAVIVSKAAGFDPGTAGGLIAGALTQSSVIGTTESALQGLGLSAKTLAEYQSNVAITYAVTYIIGTLFVVILIKNVLPKLMKVNMADECRQYESKIGIASSLPAGFFAGYQPRGLRAFRLTGDNTANAGTAGALAARFSDRVAVEQVKRDGSVITAAPDLALKAGDIIALAGPRTDLIEAEKIIGPEVDERDVLNIEGESVSIWVTGKDVVGKTLGEIGEKYGNGIFLRKAARQGHEIPLSTETIIQKGDTFEVIGAKDDVERLIKVAGYPERATEKTDLIFLGLGIIVGILTGLLSLKIKGVPLSLGAGGGVLVAGLVFGWLRSVHPTFGSIPSPAQWLMQDMGLNLFIAVVGLTAGPKAIHSLATAGISVVLAGFAVALIPHLFTAFVGKKLLKMNPVEIIGGLCGAGTCTAALNAVRDDAQSAAPVLFYTPAYAIGNVLLTIWGPVIVAIMS